MTKKTHYNSPRYAFLVAAFCVAIGGLSIALHLQSTALLSQLSGEDPVVTELPVMQTSGYQEPEDFPMFQPEPPVEMFDQEVTAEDVFQTIILQKQQIDMMQKSIISMQQTLSTLNATIQEMRADQREVMETYTHSAAPSGGFLDRLWALFGGNDTNKTPVEEDAESSK